MIDNGQQQRLNILKQAADDKLLAPLRKHGWTASIERDVVEGDGYLIVVASRNEATRRAAVLYSSASSNALYRRLEGEVDIIFFNGRPYMTESFAMGVSKPVKALDDSHLVLVDWNRETSQTVSIVPTDLAVPLDSSLGPRRLLSESPIEAIWARLSQLKSATLARKMIAQRGAADRIPLGEADIASKGEGVAYAIRNAIDYFAPNETHNVSQRVLNLYYGSLSFAFAELLAAPGGARTLAELENATKQGHGLYMMDGPTEGFNDLAVGALKSGFFGHWAKTLSAEGIVSIDRKPKTTADLGELPEHSWLTLEQLFARIPELADIYVDVFDGSPAWLRVVYDMDSNGHFRLNASGERPDATYLLLIDGSGRFKAEDVQIFPGALREITSVASGTREAHFRVAVDHPSDKAWYHVLPLHRSPFERTALTLPIFGTLYESRATCLVVLYALSILVRYRPGLWRRIQEGDLDQFRALIETFLTLVERMLPEQFLGTVTGQQIHVQQPGALY